MKVTFEFPDNTKAVIMSYVAEKDGGMYMSLKNVTTAELYSGETIKLREPENDEWRQQENE